MEREDGVIGAAGLPADYVNRMEKLLGEKKEAFFDSYRNRSYHALRFNPLKKGAGPQRYPEYLKELGIERPIGVPWQEHAFYYGSDAAPGKHPYHEIGLYYIQEPSAMSAAALLEARPGERVLDLCAAPGGKSTQIAAAMEQKGLLVSNEIHPARAKILSQNVERMGIANTVVCNEDSGRLAGYFPNFFHRILVDAPCSGEGMFRKNPQAMQEWSLRNVEICAARQGEILDNAAQMLTNGGRLVYSTCTFSPEENEQVIAAFLERHPEFEIKNMRSDMQFSCFGKGRPEWADNNPKLADTFRLWPHKLQGEGHYAAVLSKGPKITEEIIDEHRSATKKGLTKVRWEQINEFMDAALVRRQADMLLEGEMVLFGDQLYRLPDQMGSIAGLCVARAGLHLGTFRKKRFEPSHALALFLGREDVINAVELSMQQDGADVAAYLRGEALHAKEGKGWSLVCIDGCSAGWGKLAGGMLKNHYPKGLRK